VALNTRSAGLSGSGLARSRSCYWEPVGSSPRLSDSQIAAVSVGIVGGEPVLDLDYAEDSQAETDMNVVMNNGGAFVEVQGTAEGHAFRRHELDALLDLATAGIAELLVLQSEALRNL